MIITFAILALAAIANAVMDTINFHYTGSRLEKIDKDRHWWGPIETTWQNKNRYTGFLRWLMRGPLVSLTDGWHFFQFIMFTAYQFLIASLLPDMWENLPRWANIAGLIVLMKLLHGISFEPFYILLSMSETEKRALLLWIKQKWWIVSVSILIAGFLTPYVMVYHWYLASGVWLWVEILIAGAAILGCVKFILWAQKPLKRGGGI